MTGRGTPLDVSLIVSDSTVRLVHAGLEVSAVHGGVRPGLQNALYDVHLERIRRGVVSARDLTAGTGDRPGLMSLRRAGRLLAESFLPEPVSQALHRLVDQAVRRHVAVRLGVEAPTFPGLPWEALPEPVSGIPLALHPNVTVYRRSATDEPPELAGPLRIVVAIASPDQGGGQLLDYEHELRAVLASVRSARRYGAQVEVVPFATTRAIKAAVSRPGGVHVLHISAHGKPGVLILEDENGAAREITSEQLLKEAIPPGQMPPVLALAACYTDVGGEQEGASFAANLAARGACAVIGTQTTVTDRYATLLFAKVYAELAESSHPDAVWALADARRKVQDDVIAGADRAAELLAGMDEWGVVTLLASAPEVRVIDHSRPRVEASVSRTAQWGPVGARPVGRFVGRRALQRQLPAVLTGDEHAGLVLHGIGGVGKTALAAEVLRRTLEADPEWRVASLFGPVTADRVLTEVAAAVRRDLLLRDTVTGPAVDAVRTVGRLDVPWTDRFALLRDHALDTVPILLVLDNFEDNLGAHGITDPALAGLLAAWAASPARSRLLITCRHPVPVARLLAVPVGPLTAAETGKLLWSLPRLDQYAVSEEATERIWRSVGGHPRSLEYLDALLGPGQGQFTDITERLTGAVTARLGPGRAATWLGQNRTLDSAIVDVVTLAADDVLLTEHLDRLGRVPGAVDLLVAISVHREPVPADALGTHLGTRLAGLAELLRLLADSSLIHYEPDLDEVFMHRWTATELHERWRRTVVSDRDQLQRAHRAAAGYHRRRAVAQSQDHIRMLHDLTETRHHLQAAGDLDEASTITELICAQLESTGNWDEVSALINDTLRWLPTASPRQPVHVYNLAAVTFRLGDHAGSERLSQQALRVFKQAGNQSGIAACLHQLGMIAHDRGDHTEAEHHYRESLRLNTQLGDASGKATDHHQLGVLARDRGDMATAEHHYQLSGAVKRQMGDLAGVARDHGQQGDLAYRCGDFAAAEHHYELAAEAFNDLGDRAGLARTHGQRALLHHDRGDYEAAGKGYQAAATLFEELGDEIGRADVYHQIGTLARDRGDLVEAQFRYEQSLAINEQLGYMIGQAAGLLHLGILAQDRHSYAEAQHRYEQARTIDERVGNQAGVAAAYHQLGSLAQDQAKYTEARQHYQASLAINKRLKNQAGVADINHQLGMLALAQRDFTEAKERLNTSAAVYQSLGKRADLARSLSQLGSLHMMTVRLDEAIRLLARAATIRLDIGAPQAITNLRALRKLRALIGVQAFEAIVAQVLDLRERHSLKQRLDRLVD